MELGRPAMEPMNEGRRAASVADILDVNHSVQALEVHLDALRTNFALSAQEVYDAWDASDPEHGDPEVGFGGICHLIAESLGSIVERELPWTATSTLSHQDEVHVSLLVWAEEPDGAEVDPDGVMDVVGVDIPPYLYERGGGYSWTKIPGVVFKSGDVIMSTQRIRRADLDMIQDGY